MFPTMLAASQCLQKYCTVPHASRRIIPGFPDKDGGHKEFLFSLPRFADDAVSCM